MVRALVLAGLGLLALLPPPVAAAPGERAVIVRVEGVPPEGLVAAGARTPGALAAALQAQAHRSLARVTALLSARRVPFRRLWLLNGVAFSASEGVVAEVAALPEVVSVVPDGRFSLAETGESPLPASWNLEAVGAPTVWSQGPAGRGQVVAILDTGVDGAHPDLAGRWAGAWFDPFGPSTFPFDGDGHGTGVAGVAVGGAASGTALGVAPGAGWIAARIFDDQGVATHAAVHAAFQWLLDPDGNPATDDAPVAVAAAWGFEGSPGVCLDTFQADVRALRAVGIPAVFSGGNGGPVEGTDVSPANYPESLSAGAADGAGQVAGFSGRGPSACDGGTYPDLVAPGVSVPTADLDLGVGDPWTEGTGTSLAVPHLVGGLALLAEAYPARGAEAWIRALAAGARPAEGTGAGAGHLDLPGALAWLAGLDADGDGWSPPEDCDDTDPEVHPGAEETPRDGVDQDCDGADLTLYAEAGYDPARAILSVTAWSERGADAALEVVGFGPMRWQRKLEAWTLTARKIPADPGVVTVSGPEGAVTVPTAAP